MFRSFFNFRFRLNAAIFLVAVGATVTGLAYYYKIVSTQIWSQMMSRVKDFGKIGTTLLTPEDLKYLERLDADLNPAQRPGKTPSVPVSGATLTALADAEKTAIVRSNQFQFIVQKLRRIRHASGKNPVNDATLPAGGIEQDAQIHRVWIAGVKMHEHASQFLRVLCADEFEEIDRNNNRRIDPEESIYHIGDVFNGRGQSGITTALAGEVAVGTGYRSENSGVYISGYTPIKNNRGKIIALLIIDFSAATEFDALFNLKITGYYIIICVLLFSIIAASATSRFLLKPLENMQRAAIRIGQRDFSVRIESRNTDELADLAYALNLMAQELGEYSVNMEKRIATRTQEISGILESLEQGLLTVDRQGIIQTEYSQATLNIFGLTELAHRKFSTLFEEKIATAVDKYLDVFFSGHAITDQMLERANPLREIGYLNHRGEKRHLRFAFRTLSAATDAATQKLLISIIDDTAEFSLREKIDLAEADKRSEFDVLINLMQIPPAILENFIIQQRDFLSKGKELIMRFDSAEAGQFSDFSKQVHALKGNALQLGFKLLAEILHDLETHLQTKGSGKSHDAKYLRHEISRCINASENVILDRDKLVTRIRALVGSPTSDDPAIRIRQLKTFWISQIEQKAAEREVPVTVQVNFHEDTDAALHLLHNVLVQLLRNTFAHGVEAPAIRLAAGKKAELTIAISTRLAENAVELIYAEDGKGFSQILPGKSTPLADLIQKGLTAAPVSVTLEAGRGLGMEYITARIVELGGKAYVSAAGGLTQISITLPL